MRDLDQDAGAVARLRIAAASAAMRQVDQDLDAFADDFVGLFAVQIDDEAHAAGVVLVLGVVQPLLERIVSEYLRK